MVGERVGVGVGLVVGERVRKSDGEGVAFGKVVGLDG